MTGAIDEKTAKKGFTAVVFFYLLIAFEFFYMASPFAAYFYSVYRPGLDFMNGYPRLAWITGFFLPHIVVETKSPLICLHNTVGIVLAVGGFLAFVIGAGQVYYRKLAKKGPAVGGIYRYIRHPQYLSLAVSGLGLLLLWPRYLVLVMYISVLFVYYLLARFEEAECLKKFGRPYQDYLGRTGMFLPFTTSFIPRLQFRPRSRPMRVLLIIGCYVAFMAIGLGAAAGLRHLSTRSLYGYYTENTATISLVKMSNADLKRIVDAAMADKTIMRKLDSEGDAPSTRYLNYVLPADWSVSELPMNPIEEHEGDHFLLSDYRGSRYRVIINRAVIRRNDSAHGKDIVLSAAGTIPLAEVLIDMRSCSVVGVEDPVAATRYGNMPMPVF